MVVHCVGVDEVNPHYSVGNRTNKKESLWLDQTIDNLSSEVKMKY